MFWKFSAPPLLIVFMLLVIPAQATIVAGLIEGRQRCIVADQKSYRRVTDR